MSYEVIVTNEILGNSVRVMTKKDIARFNLCALALSDKVDVDGQAHTDGMWTVKPAREGQ